MKKLTILSVLALTIVTFSQMSFAASQYKTAGESYMVIEGTILSIDKTKNFFVIKDKEDGRTYGLNGSDLASFNQGESVKVTLPHPGNLVSKITR